MDRGGFGHFWRKIITLDAGTLLEGFTEMTHRASVPAVVVPVSRAFILWWRITMLLRQRDCDDDAEG